ncbi:hypothetical protein G210_5455 [Candida maltosa Xu316]|uniref:FAD/NAD(P)-binding domain-containing protein n=1 Tax=Candida maltosa (strain Xu316) TaxID=1245528 RepID=M3K4P5_CANMX|nr:hypothetical protein G210_5455 [Candida maltosa Xu316]
MSARLMESHPGSLFTEDEHQRFHWLKQRGHKTNLLNSRQHSPYIQNKFNSENLLVLDSMNDRFMGQWDSQFDACQIPYLRSPMFFHVDPANIDGMVTYAYSKGRGGELMEITNVVGKEVSKHKQKRVKQKQQKSMMMMMKKGNGGGSTHDNPGIVDVNMRDWKDYYRPATKLFRDHCNDVIMRYRLEDRVRKDEVVSVEYMLIQSGDDIGKGMVVKTASGEMYGCKIAIVASGHRGDINYPIKPFDDDPHFPEGSCHTTHLFTKKAIFLDDSKFHNPKSKRIVIVGGGLTSAQLAYVAAQNPTVSSIHLLFRSPIKIKHFDFHLDWVTKYKNVKKSAFFIRDTDEEKFEMINAAREGGSINPEYYKKVLKLSKSKRINWMTSTQITKQEWNEETKTWNLEVTDGEGETSNLIDIDYIYFATGVAANIKSLEFLQPVISNHPIDIVGGYPCLTDNLQWNEEVPLFMMGKNAALRVGPTSANLDGARLGAERVGWYLQDLKSKGEFDWGPVKSVENTETSSYLDTRLQLASGQLNWFTLLDNS